MSRNSLTPVRLHCSEFETGFGAAQIILFTPVRVHCSEFVRRTVVQFGFPGSGVGTPRGWSLAPRHRRGLPALRSRAFAGGTVQQNVDCLERINLARFSFLHECRPGRHSSSLFLVTVSGIKRPCARVFHIVGRSAPASHIERADPKPEPLRSSQNTIGDVAFTCRLKSQRESRMRGRIRCREG
jgi:hypothetical protein